MKKTRFQFSLVALLALFVLFGAFSSKPAKAAEIYTGNSDTLEGAVSCPLGLLYHVKRIYRLSEFCYTGTGRFYPC